MHSFFEDFIGIFPCFLNYDPTNRNPIAHLEYIEQSIPDSDMKSKVWFMRIYRQVMRSFYQVL